MNSGSTVPTGPRRDSIAATRGRRWAVAALLLVACAARVGWIALARLSPFDGVYYDMAWYHIAASQIAAGNGLSDADGVPTARWPPVYPALVALAYRLAGPSLEVGRLLNPVFGALASFFTYRLGCRLAGWKVGIVAGFLYALCLDEIFFASFVMSEPCFGAIFLGCVLLFVALEQRVPKPRPWAWLGLGVALGLATLTRAIAAAWLTIPCAIWLASTRSWRISLARTGFAALGLALVVAPWTARNAVRMGYPIPIASSVGLVLANAHSPWETGGPSRDAMIQRRRFERRFTHLPFPEREVAVMRAYTRASIAYMLTHPGHELRVLPNRVRNLFLHGHVGLLIGRRRLAPGEPDPFLTPGWNRAIAGVADAFFFALLALGVVGLPRWLRGRDRSAWLVPLTLGYFCFWHLVVFPADPRYHLPMLPFLALSAARIAVGARNASAASRPATARPQRLDRC